MCGADSDLLALLEGSADNIPSQRGPAHELDHDLQQFFDDS